MEEDKLLEMFGDIKATRNDIKWIKEKIRFQNGVLSDHVKESDKFRMQVTRNTVWRHAFKIAIGSLFAALMWVVFK